MILVSDPVAIELLILTALGLGLGLGRLDFGRGVLPIHAAAAQAAVSFRNFGFSPI